MSDLSDLLERAMHDLQQGWPEAAYDCIGRAWRLLDEREELHEAIGGIVAQALAEHDRRIGGLEEERTRREDRSLPGLNKYRKSTCQRLRKAVKAIVAEYAPEIPNAPQVRAVLIAARYHPLPGVRAVQKHLEAIRGPGVGKRGPNRNNGTSRSSG